MSGKRKTDYCAVFTSILNLLKQDGNLPEVQEFMLDFEKAAWQACRTIFPAVKPVGCSFHLTQSFYRNIKKIGLAPQYRKDQETRKICRQMLSLHLLPAEKIVKQFQNIKDGASGLMLKFCCYVEDNYIKSTVWTPSNWSMHGQHIRTNNHVEGTHNKLKAVVGKIRITEILKKN
jgi:hypothetical protein